jgi:hypothetical protein
MQGGTAGASPEAGGPGQGGGEAKPKDEDVVDADYKEVKRG